MLLSITPLLSLSLITLTQAHYLFGRLILDGVWTDTWEYVREIKELEGASAGLELVSPNVNPDSLDLRCGRGASTSWTTVKTATVTAGDTVGFAAGEPALSAEPPTMYHPGFASAWLSKSPVDDLTAYQGDGDWFKILQVTGVTEQSLDYTLPENENMYDQFKSVWGTFQLGSYNFTIPNTTPAGKYLLRFEHIFPNEVDAQYYVNCAHVEIVNGGFAGTPSPVVQIPGVYVNGQPDVYFSIYDFNFDIETFEGPAPVVWSG